VWCPVNPRNEAAENAELLDLFDVSCLIFASGYADLVERIRQPDSGLPELPRLTTLVCLDRPAAGAPSFDQWTAGLPDGPDLEVSPVDDIAMIVGTGGTTGRPKGVMLTGRNLRRCRR